MSETKSRPPIPNNLMATGISINVIGNDVEGAIKVLLDYIKDLDKETILRTANQVGARYTSPCMAMAEIRFSYDGEIVSQRVMKEFREEHGL